MNYESIYDKNPAGARELLRDKMVGIAGCGGLGSNLAINLARMGVGKLVIADFDTIAISNLNCQQYFVDQMAMPKVMALRNLIMKISPTASVITHEFKLFDGNLSIFDKCQVVAECFDNAEDKAMLVNFMLKQNRPVVAVSGVAGDGPTDKIKVCFKKPNFILIGDEETPPCAQGGLFSARVSAAAAHQAWAVYHLLREIGK